MLDGICTCLKCHDNAIGAVRVHRDAFAVKVRSFDDCTGFVVKHLRTETQTDTAIHAAGGGKFNHIDATCNLQPHGLSAGCIDYALPGGNVAEEVCYWRDMTLVPHLLNLLGKRRLEARLCLTELQQPSADRKQLARQLHSEVVRLKEACSV